jgi:dTDP-4-dehydrorhamnose reductase
MPDTLILGHGYIGSRLLEEFDANISNRKIYSFEKAEDEIKKFHPKIIINCIGFTGNNVDECENNIDKTLMANTFIPIILGEVCLRNNIKLVHISSGCIYNYNYDWDNPLEEDDTPDFLGLFYSRSKIYSEFSLNAFHSKYPYLITRIRIPLDNIPTSKNLLTKLISYKKSIDVPNSITYIPDFIKALKHLIEIDAKGTYNVVNDGGLRYPKLLDIYKRYNPDFNYELMDYKLLNRTNLLLSTDKLKRSGFEIRNINDVLEECVKEYIEYDNRKSI